MTAVRPMAVPLGFSTGDAHSDFVVREARMSDNPGLVALAAACPMVGDLTLRIDRRPDFFALNKLEGEEWRVAVAERGGSIVGCAAFSERRVFLNGREMRTGYAGDLKVHPDHRNTKIADALSLWAENACADLPFTAPAVITVLAGNRAMERRLAGPRGVPRFNRIGTIRSHSIPILWNRVGLRRGSDSIRIGKAGWSDVSAMARLWSLVARERQLAPVMTPSSFSAWVSKAPGLDITSYRLARSASGELLGFLGVWDSNRSSS